MAEHSNGVRIMARLAFGQLDTVTEPEREQVLLALQELLPDGEAELAEQALYHLREQRRAQLTLRGLLENSQEGKS